MADVITRFKLETTQYDSKLRDSVKGLKEVVQMAEIAGKDFKGFSQKTLEAARSLGNVATGATNSKDKVKELVGAFNDMAKTYNTMSKDLRESDVGKALAESMTQLQGRIKEAKTEMNSTGGVMDQLAQKFTINIDAIKLFNVGLSAAKAALDVAKDAFFASEANVDEWGRTMKAAEGVYAGFLNALNTGDFSGFLTRIDDIVKAAREAYNELDRLGTMKTIQSPAFSKQEAENARMRTMLMTGRYIAPANGAAAPGMKTGDLLSPEQIRNIERHLQNGMNTIVNLTKNEVTQTGRAIDAYYNSLAKQNGMSYAEFKQGTSSMSEFDKRMAGYQKYQEWRAAHTTIDLQSGREIVARGNPYQNYAQWGSFRVDKQGTNSYNDLVNLIKQQQQQSSQMYSTIGQAYRTINRAEGITVKGLLGGGSGGSGGSGINFIGDFEKFLGKSVVGADSLKGSDDANFLSPYAMMLDDIKKKILDVKDADLGSALKIPDIARQQAEEYARGITAIQKSISVAASLVGTIGQAFNAIEDPAGRVAATVAQAIANVALAYSDAMAKTVGEKFNIWSFIAAAAASTVSMVSTIASIHSATGYAEGGMIKGNSYSGDNLMAMGPSGLIGLNAGEIVLNAAGQQNVAANLRGGAMGGMSLKTKVRGTELLVWLDNSLAQSGRGELVTWGT